MGPASILLLAFEAEICSHPICRVAAVHEQPVTRQSYTVAALLAERPIFAHLECRDMTLQSGTRAAWQWGCPG